MQLDKSIQIGKEVRTFHGKGEDLFEVIADLKTVGIESVLKCGCCSSDYLKLDAFETKEQYRYVKVICKKCKASLTAGKTKKGGIYYWRRKEGSRDYDWQPYVDPNKAVNDDAVEF